jgi:hypothetical protein
MSALSVIILKNIFALKVILREMSVSTLSDLWKLAVTEESVIERAFLSEVKAQNKTQEPVKVPSVLSVARRNNGGVLWQV